MTGTIFYFIHHALFQASPTACRPTPSWRTAARSAGPSPTTPTSSPTSGASARPTPAPSTGRRRDGRAASTPMRRRKVRQRTKYERFVSAATNSFQETVILLLDSPPYTKYKGGCKKWAPGFENFRQVEVVSKSRNIIHQTWGPL